MVALVVPPWPDPDSLLACLDPAEAERLLRIRHRGTREAKLVVHSLLRLLLARIDGAHPSDHSLARDGRGRPRPVRLPQWSCSLSDDPRGVAVAIGRGSDAIDWLGVDVCRPLSDPQWMQPLLHPQEQHLLAAEASPPARSLVLARCWAGKEALLKRWGWGLVSRLSLLNTAPGSHALVLPHRPAGAEPASASTITTRIHPDGPAVALAHRPDQVPTWWMLRASELEAAIPEP